MKDMCGIDFTAKDYAALSGLGRCNCFFDGLHPSLRYIALSGLGNLNCSLTMGDARR